MTNQRFTETLSTGIVTDHITGREYKCEMRIDDDLLKLLNELHEENQLVKDTLNELKSIDGFWDSALLQGYISKIAKILGVDLE